MTMNPRNLGPCLVCGQAAVGINFAVATCAPCKAFFRRNAVKLGRIDFICEFDGDCPVKHESRRICNCCRLAKCFRVGMQKSLIRTAAERESRKELIEQNRNKRSQLAIIQKSSSIRPATICHLTQTKSECLFLSDQALLTNIFGVYEKVYAAADSCQYSCFPTVEHSTMHTFFNEFEQRHRLLVDYLKFIPEFNRLSIDDKISLVRSHFTDMMTINERILTRSIHKNLIISFKNLYGINLANNLIHMHQRFFIYTCDPLQLKLILIITSLSSGIYRYSSDTEQDCICDDTLAIFAGQNYYAELLWRYLLSRLPSERDVVNFFNNLILDLLFVHSSCFVVERFMYNLAHEIDKMTPLMQSMWHISDKKNNMDYGDIDVKPYASEE